MKSFTSWLIPVILCIALFAAPSAPADKQLKEDAKNIFKDVKIFTKDVFKKTKKKTKEVVGKVKQELNDDDKGGGKDARSPNE